MNIQGIWQFVMSWPDVTEAPHYAKTSLRVKGRIFATVPPGGEYLHVLLDEPIARFLLTPIRKVWRSCGGGGAL